MKVENIFCELQKEMNALFKSAVCEKYFSGAAVGVSLFSGKKRETFTGCYGTPSFYSSENIHTSTFFDLASLTKPLATTMAVLCLIKEKKIYPDEKIGNFFGSGFSLETKDITISDILNHSSGLPSYRVFYKDIIGLPLSERKERLCQLVLKEPFEYTPHTQSLYSDLGFMLLDSIVEKRAGMSLEKYLQKKMPEYFGVSKGLVFNPMEKKITNCACTEKCSWRKKVLCGEVDDENTWAVGGISGQAGLFGTIESVVSITNHILDVWLGKEKDKNIERETLKLFLESRKTKNSSWAMGFDTPSPEYSSGGKYLSRNSVGHLGFTGTSFWIDPDKELVMVLLTNRVHPSRENNAIRKFRPLFHDKVIEKLGLAEKEAKE
ncbi:MAG: serine hydrolase [Desulfobulbaceae bacterium]|uniref:Serine hydrolase n=1 Tax=Candidatus Desulfobia pelagia TaxID=2841692 RepID=A0A8J6TFM2_9BACT|nr:serine hydrolase [Candidatus Desulfobia pelagia]